MLKIVDKLYPALIVGVGAVMPFIALAQTDSLSPVAANIFKLINTLVSVVFILAVLVFGWGIVKFIAASGDPEKIKSAKQFILWGVIGITVLASIFGLIQFIQGYFGVIGGAGTIAPPTVPLQ